MRSIPFEVIRDTTLRRLSVSADEFHGVGRMPRAVWSRRIVANLCRRLTGFSFPEIAANMGRPNHSTVIDAHNAMESALAIFPGLADDVAKIEVEIRQIVKDQDAIERATFENRKRKSVSQPAHVAPR